MVSWSQPAVLEPGMIAQDSAMASWSQPALLEPGMITALPRYAGGDRAAIGRPAGRRAAGSSRGPRRAVRTHLFPRTESQNQTVREASARAMQANINAGAEQASSKRPREEEEELTLDELFDIMDELRKQIKAKPIASSPADWLVGGTPFRPPRIETPGYDGPMDIHSNGLLGFHIASPFSPPPSARVLEENITTAFSEELVCYTRSRSLARTCMHTHTEHRLVISLAFTHLRARACTHTPTYNLVCARVFLSLCTVARAQHCEQQNRE